MGALDLPLCLIIRYMLIGTIRLCQSLPVLRHGQVGAMERRLGTGLGGAWGRIDTLFHLQVYNKTEKSVVHVYEHPFIDGNLEQMDTLLGK